MSFEVFLKWSGAIGLVLDIIGAYLIYKFGLPEEVSKSGTVNLVIEEEDPEEIEKARKYDKLSKLGFYILIAGFILQLVSSVNTNMRQ